MVHRLLALAAAVSVTACSGPSGGSSGDKASGEASLNNTAGCEATASSTWRSGNGSGLTVEARTLGQTCVNALAALIIRGPDGVLLWAEAYPAQDILTLRDANDLTSMQASLTDWIGAEEKTTGELPEWPAGADAPSAGEFPFYPDEGWDREAYSALREEGAPMVCHVQGLESLLCLALNNGGVSTIGVQTFPG